MAPRFCTLVLALAALTALPAQAQPPAAPPAVPPGVPPGAMTPVKPDDVTAVAHGWLLLSQGAAAPAADRARDVLKRSPFSPGAIVLAVEAELARGGFSAGLAEYERLFGTRPFEEPTLLRRVSQVLLREATGQTTDPRARLTALRALAADGDATASSELAAAMAAGNEAAARILAETGNAEGVQYLIDGMKTRIVDPVRALDALSKTRNAQVVTIALRLLDDPRSEIRTAAIDALGRMRAREAAPRLRALLADESPFLRVSAAAALLAIGDDAGLPIIQELAKSESAEARIHAADALAGRKDAAWVEMVRGLTTAEEPEVRARAARLIAPIDPELAARVLGALQNDPNPALRTLAGAAAFETAGSDLRRLRGFLHATSLEQRVLASEKVLIASR